MATGDFDGDGLGDFAVGAPGELSGAGVVRVYLGQLGFVPNPHLGASPTLYLHDDAPALTLEGDVAMGLGRALASGGDLLGDSGDELVIGDAEGAWVVDVAASLAGPSLVDVSAAESVQLLAGASGSAVRKVP